MHDWSDDTVDWKGINDAAAYIALGLRKWWRVPVRDYKEKYGTVRVYCDFGWYQFHDMTHPGYCFNRYPKWLWRLDCHYGSRICKVLNYLIVPLHVWAYRRYYSAAVRKWPHLRLEILSGADYHELLRHEGVYTIRTSDNSYTIHIDWSPKPQEITEEHYTID